MIDEGEQAPRFELTGVRDGDIEQVTLGEYLGENIVILAFYPGDFNPACSEESTDLDELDLFTMQKDVSILGISGDSVYSHRAFADEYDLHIPLLSDAHGTVAAAYGVETDEGTGYPNRRGVFVINQTNEVEFAWIADDVQDLPDTDEIRERIEGVGGDKTAQARYRVGHARYMEGRRAFTSAMSAYEDKEWMLAQTDFTQAHKEFGTARDEFNTANRFGEDEEKLKYYDRAERKAESLWRAAEWLSDSANAFASGEGGEAERLRRDAESPLETARDVHEPPVPDEFPPEEDPAEHEEEEVSILPDDEQDVDTSLEADFEDGTDSMDGLESSTDAAGETSTADSKPEAVAGTTEGSPDDEEAESSIDDDELEEIAAELEQQTEAASEKMDSEIDDGNVVPDSVDIGSGVETGNGTQTTDGDEGSAMFEADEGPEDDTGQDGNDQSKVARQGDGSSEGAGASADTTTDGTPAETGDSHGAGHEDDIEADDDHDAENIEGELEADDIELDLTDPTEGEDDEEDDEEELTDDDIEDGDHGVPDSL